MGDWCSWYVSCIILQYLGGDDDISPQFFIIFLLVFCMYLFRFDLVFFCSSRFLFLILVEQVLLQFDYRDLKCMKGGFVMLN